MEILKSYWFTPMGGDLIGVVKVKPEFGDIKYYIGTIKKWPGETLDKKEDEEIIANTGAKFPIDAGRLLIP